MITKNTLGLLLIGLIAVLSINAVVEQPRDVKPVYYNSFGSDIHGEILKGVSKYKGVFDEAGLKDKNFYIIYSECDAQKLVVISYLSCEEEDCLMRNMVDASNRYIRITDEWQIPIVFKSDLSHANIFSRDGLRMTPPIDGYAIELDKDNEVVSTNFVNY